MDARSVTSTHGGDFAQFLFFAQASEPTAGAAAPAAPAPTTVVPGMPAAGGPTGAAPGGENQPITAAPGGAGGAPAPSPMSSMLPLWVLLGVMIMLIVFSSMGQRKERKKRDAMLGALKRNDRVQTIGGIIGTIIEIADDEVVLKTDETTNTRIRFARSAVQSVLKEAAA